MQEAVAARETYERENWEMEQARDQTVEARMDLRRMERQGIR
jgi:hypothetical protein